MIQCPYCPSPHRNGICNACGVDLRKGPVGCKQCPGNLKSGDIVCLKCGLNLLTGQRIAPGQGVVRERKPFPWAAVGLVAAVLVLLGAAGGGAAWLLLRDPVAEARRMAREGRALEAIGKLQEHLQAKADDHGARHFLGELQYQAQDFTSAVTTLDTVAAADPANEQAALLALAAAAKLPGDAGRGRQTAALRRLAENQPGNAEYRHWLGLALAAGGDHAGASEAFDAALAVDPGFRQARFHRGVARALRGDYDGAAEDLLAGQGAISETALAAVDGLRGDEDRAGLRLAATAAEADAAARRRHGALLLARGEVEEALGLLRARPGETDTPASQYLQALALQAIGLDIEAMQLHQVVSESGGAVAGAAAAQLAELFLAQGDLTRANEYTRRAAAQQRGARVLTIEGRIRLAEGEAEQAGRLFREAIALEPGYAPAHLEHGLYQVSRNNLVEGVRALEQFLALSRADGDSPRLNEIEMLVSQLRQTVGERSAS